MGLQCSSERRRASARRWLDASMPTAGTCTCWLVARINSAPSRRPLAIGRPPHVIDLSEIMSARAAFGALLEAIGDIDVVVVSAGTGDENPDLDWSIEKRTFDVNVIGFAAAADASINHFRATGGGHLIGITSVAALRGSGPAASYAATKAFQSTYLDGLRALGVLFGEVVLDDAGGGCPSE